MAVVTKLNIVSVKSDAQPLVFTTLGTSDEFRIKRRYTLGASGDIENYDALKTAGFFRHETTTTSSVFGAGKLGYELPQTEKLFLVVTNASTSTDANLTIYGSKEYNVANKVVKIAKNGTSIVNLYDLGLEINSSGSDDYVKITTSAEVKVALVARAY